MPVFLRYKCGGCDAEALSEKPMMNRHRPFYGASHGWGIRVWEGTPEALAPKGWIAADPVTGCCYCPTCSAEIFGLDQKPDELPSNHV